MNPLVSIITPTYNCAKYLASTIDSVMHQTWDYPNIEYIIIDDGSTDRTDEVLRIYKNYPEVKVISRENWGEQRTVNQGLDMAKGKYGMIVNADDPLLPRCVSRLVAYMELNPELVAVYPDWLAIDEENNLIRKVTSRKYDYNFMVEHHFCIPSVGTMFRLDKGARRDESLRWVGDYAFWLNLAKEGNMERMPMILATWRQRNGQATNDKNDIKAEEHIKLMARYLHDDINHNRRLSMAWANIVASQISPNRLHYIIQAIKAWPPVIFDLELWDALRKKLTAKVRVDPRR